LIFVLKIHGILFLKRETAIDCKVDYYRSQAPIIIDGKLDDWVNINAKIQYIHNPVVFDWLTYPNNGDFDISGVFRFVADPIYLYIAVMVKDDFIITNAEKPRKGYENDSVILCFGDMVIDDERIMNEIRITMCKNDPANILETQGIIDMNIPYLLEAYGVKCRLNRDIDKYTTEIAIPYTLLSWISSPKEKPFKFNIYT